MDRWIDFTYIHSSSKAISSWSQASQWKAHELSTIPNFKDLFLHYVHSCLSRTLIKYKIIVALGLWTQICMTLTYKLVWTKSECFNGLFFCFFQLPCMTAYIRFCSRQLSAAKFLQQLTEESADFRNIVKQCQSDPRTNGMPLSSFLIKPMQRITKYPLLIKKVSIYYVRESFI
jgi:hypothetical protein